MTYRFHFEKYCRASDELSKSIISKATFPEHEISTYRFAWINQLAFKNFKRGKLVEDGNDDSRLKSLVAARTIR